MRVAIYPLRRREIDADAHSSCHEGTTKQESIYMNPVAVLARIFKTLLTPARVAGFTYWFTLKMLETGDPRESLFHITRKTLIPLKVSQ